MKNTKELQLLLGSIYCLNRSGDKDPMIENILNYTFERVYGSSTRMLLLTCLGKTRAEIESEVSKLLNSETKFASYMAMINSFNTENNSEEE